MVVEGEVEVWVDRGGGGGGSGVEWKRMGG